RVRRRVLPELERINPQVRAALARLAEVAAAVDESIATEASTTPGTKASTTPHRPGTSTESARVIELAALPRDDPARDRALVDMWRDATGRALGARHRAALLALTRSSAGTSALDLPGGTAVRQYGQ